jgi:hypothetical protein
MPHDRHLTRLHVGDHGVHLVFQKQPDCRIVARGLGELGRGQQSLDEPLACRVLQRGQSTRSYEG